MNNKLSRRLWLKAKVCVAISQEFAALSHTEENPIKHKRNGSTVIQKQFQVTYSLLNNEIMILAVNHVEDNPFEALSCINRVKK